MAITVEIKNDAKGRFLSVSVNEVPVLIMGHNVHEKFPGLFDEMVIAVEEWAAAARDDELRAEDERYGLDPANPTLRKDKP